MNKEDLIKNPVAEILSFTLYHPTEEIYVLARDSVIIFFYDNKGIQPGMRFLQRCHINLMLKMLEAIEKHKNQKNARGT